MLIVFIPETRIVQKMMKMLRRMMKGTNNPKVLHLHLFFKYKVTVLGK